MAGKKQIKESRVEYSSGNVFAGIGLANPSERLAKAELASAIGQVLATRELTRAKAAELMGIDQPKVSKTVRGRLDDFSAERLVSFLLRLGPDIEVLVH